jgi:hypothetical protein
MRYHKTHLSRRLILELVADQEKEETLVNKFRVQNHFFMQYYLLLHLSIVGSGNASGFCK